MTTATGFKILILSCYDDKNLALNFRNNLLGNLVLGYGHTVTIPEPVYLEQHIDILRKELSGASIVLIFYSADAASIFYEKKGLQEELEGLRSTQKYIYWVEARASDTSGSGISFTVPERGALSSLKPVARDRMILAIAQQLSQDIDAWLIARDVEPPLTQSLSTVVLELPLGKQTCIYCGHKEIGETCPRCGNVPKQTTPKTVIVIGPDSAEDKDRVGSLATHFHSHARVKALGVSGFMHRSKLEPFCRAADLIVLLVSPDFLSEALLGGDYQGVRAAWILLQENPGLQRKCVLVHLRPCLASNLLPNVGWSFTTIASERDDIDTYGLELSQALQRL
ncbi:MAG TPA: hypothetical protein VNG90_04205 [Candidatus Acidoferrum sp.]|nr:hypothetical protein [Candidatus Acidoferrum sp.]